MSPANQYPDGNVFLMALQWLQGTLLGTLATSVAIIAIAAVGFGLMSGRVHARRAIELILGCFIIFGASSIATGMVRALNGIGEPLTKAAPPPSVAPAPLPPPPVAYDPYAGAAVPPR